VLPGATVTGTAFGATGTDPHHDTDWELSTSAAFSTLSGSSSLADATNLTAWTIPAGLTPSTTYYLRARYRSASGVVSTYSAATSFTTSAMATANTPTLTAPAAGALAENPPTLTTSAFGVSVGSDTHQMTTWQIARDAAFADIAASSIGDTANLTTWAPSTALAAGGTYYLRARHKAAAAGWSAYSATVTVQTAAAPQTAVTSILTPTADQLGFAGEVTTAPFALTSGTGVHSSTDWQIAADDTFAAPVYASMNDAVNKTALPTAAVVELVPGTFYYVRARHRDATLGASAQYSQAVRFRRMKTAAPTITSPAPGSSGFGKYGDIASSAFISDGTDVHASSEWMVSAAANFATTIMNPSGPQYLTTTKLSGASPSTTYYAKVRHFGADGGVSDWSPVVSFTTVAELGTTWTEKNSTIAGDIYECAFGNGVFVAGWGVSPPLRYAPNIPVSFTACTGLPTGTYCRSIVFTGGRFIAVLSNRATYESSNGIAWTRVGASLVISIRADMATDGVVIVAGAGGSTGAGMMHSVDGGATWANCVGATAPSLYSAICYAEDIDLFVAGIGATSYKSADGITFTAGSSLNVGNIGRISRGGGVFLAVGSTGVSRSVDGITWTKITSAAFGTKSAGCAQYIDGAWYVVTYDSTLQSWVCKSVDGGLTWVMLFNFKTVDAPNAMCFSGSTLLYVGTDIVNIDTVTDNGDGTTTTTTTTTKYPAWTYCSQ
jgi:hypothetical protein